MGGLLFFLLPRNSIANKILDKVIFVVKLKLNGISFNICSLRLKHTILYMAYFGLISCIASIKNRFFHHPMSLTEHTVRTKNWMTDTHTQTHIRLRLHWNRMDIVNKWTWMNGWVDWLSKLIEGICRRLNCGLWSISNLHILPLAYRFLSLQSRRDWARAWAS